MRRLTFAAVCGMLVLAACSDQNESPTEPRVPPPSETFGATCDHGRYPLRSVALRIHAAFPPSLPGYRALRVEALVGAGAVALLWDFCKDRLARQSALKTLAWIDSKVSGPAAEALKTAILNGFGAGAFDGSSVGGIFTPDPAHPEVEQIFRFSGGDALLALKGNAFDKVTLITGRRLPNTFRLTVPVGLQQAPPYYEVDATNSSTDNTVETHSPTPGSVTMTSCFDPVNAEYPTFPGAQVGHNPVGGGFEFSEETFRPDLEAQLPDCPPSYGGGGINLRMGPDGLIEGFASFLASAARTLFLPAPLRAATVVGGRGPISHLPASLSPFGLVFPDCETYYNYSFCGD